MKELKKFVTIYKSLDGVDFLNKYDCLRREFWLKLPILHKKLMEVKFHDNFRNARSFSDYLYGDYYITDHGRMGNKNITVRYKKHGNNVVLLRFDEGGFQARQEFICQIPLSWSDLSIDELKTEVGKFIKRKDEKELEKLKAKEKLKAPKTLKVEKWIHKNPDHTVDQLLKYIEQLT